MTWKELSNLDLKGHKVISQEGENTYEGIIEKTSLEGDWFSIVCKDGEQLGCSISTSGAISVASDTISFWLPYVGICYIKQ